jgi:HlyD family secretion protein
VLAFTAWSIRGGDQTTASAQQTTKVDTGEVQASVTANGNLKAASTVDVSFEGSGGIVKKIYVKPGDKVHRGDILAQVDQTSALQGVATAQATLASARAQYETTTQGQTSAERNRDAQSVNVARQSVDSARISLDAAKDTYRLDKSQQDQAVTNAQSQLAAATTDQQNAQTQYNADPSDANKQALDTANTNLQSARTSLRTAQNTRSTVLLQDRQNIDSRNSSLTAAQASLASTRASVAVNAQAPRQGSIDAAKAQIASAQVTLGQAKDTLAKTLLRAPASGTVAEVNGVVGESSSSTASSASSGSGSTGTTGSTSSSSSSSTTSSGFVTLTDVRVLEVTADVAEADINDVKVGQDATVTLAANSREFAGTVSAVDQVETITNNVVEYGVTVRLTGDFSTAKLGQSADISITTGVKTGVVRALSSALTTIGSTTTATVKNKDGSTRVVTVQKGLVGDTQTEIVSGLSAGDVLVVPQQSGSGGGFTFPSGGLGGIGGPS